MTGFAESLFDGLIYLLKAQDGKSIQEIIDECKDEIPTYEEVVREMRRAIKRDGAIH